MKYFFIFLTILFLYRGAFAANGAAIPNSQHDEFLRSNQSKIGWFQGSWYGIIPTVGPFWTLEKFDGSNWHELQQLEDKGTRVPDMVVDQKRRKLFILFPLPAKLYRFSYVNGAWVLDSNFPVSISGLADVSKNTPPALALAADGDLFINYMANYEIRIFYSSDAGLSWNNSPYIVRNVSNISSGLTDAIDFYWNGASYLGLFVAENSSQDYLFFRLKDTDDPSNSQNWQEESLPGSFHSDNHVNIVSDLDGNVYSIVKLGTGSSPTFVLFRRSSADGIWLYRELYSDGSNDTRPAACIDETGDQLKIYATIDDQIQMVSMSKDNPVTVSASDWSPAINNGSDIFNNVSVPCQPLGSSTGVLVCALNASDYNIWYQFTDISYTPPGDLVINEINSRVNRGASYIELHNIGSGSINLSDYAIDYFDNNATVATVSYPLSNTLPVDGYYVMAKDRSEFYSTYGFYPDMEVPDFPFDGGRDGIGLYHTGSPGRPLIDQFNQLGGLLSAWEEGQLFNRNETANDGANIYVDYWLAGTDKTGSPGERNDQSLPVSLAELSSVWNGRDVVVQWRTESELNNQRFLLYRQSFSSDDSVTQFLSEIPGNGTTSIPHIYSFVDTRCRRGSKYRYFLSTQDYDGRIHEYPQSTEITIPAVTGFTLFPAYPNPFNSRITISFQLASRSRIRTAIYDLLGNEVRLLADGFFSGGVHKLSWDARNNESIPVAGGIYFIRFDGADKHLVRKIVLIK